MQQVLKGPQFFTLSMQETYDFAEKTISFKFEWSHKLI